MKKNRFDNIYIIYKNFDFNKRRENESKKNEIISRFSNEISQKSSIRPMVFTETARQR